MSLAIHTGAVITIYADGSDEQEALNKLVHYVEQEA